MNSLLMLSQLEAQGHLKKEEHFDSTEWLYEINGQVIPVLLKERYGIRVSFTIQDTTNSTLILPELQFRTNQISKFDTAIVIDGLYYKHNQPRTHFANGKIRKMFISSLVGRLNNHKKEWPETYRRLGIVTSIWSELDPHQKTEFVTRQTHTPEGQPLFQFSSFYTINEEGSVVQIRNSKNNYDLSSLCRRIIGPIVYIHKDQPTTQIIIVGLGTFNVTEQELLWVNRNYTKCERCGKYEDKDSTIFGLCRVCTQDIPRELSGYSTKAPDILISKTQKGKFPEYYTGVELEYELTGKNSKAETIFLLHSVLKDHAIFKRDGSLSNGVEICTRPACINTQEEAFLKFWENQTLQDNLVVKSTCGMHVHIDKRKLSALTLGKLIQFMQHKNNEDFLTKIAGRVSKNYAALGTGHTATSILDRSIHESRYNAVNMQNTNTVEIRIFKTPSSMPEFMKNMEFVDTLRSFVLPANSGITEQKWENFADFVGKNRKLYPNLYKFIKETC